MSAVTDYMKGFGPDNTEVSNNAMITYLLIDPKAATVLALVILSTYFAKGVSRLMEVTPRVSASPQGGNPSSYGSSDHLGHEVASTKSIQAEPGEGSKKLPKP